jgi:GNAT superfamily N-acetyltransferase
MPDNSNMLAIKRAEPEDAALVRDITRRAYAKWVQVIGREPLPMVVDYAKAVLVSDIHILSLDEVPVAIVVLERKHDSLYIDNLAVEPAAQGKGFGRHLLQHVEREAQQYGVKKITLLTNAAFASNVSFYLAHGFVIDRTEPFMNGTTVYMSKAVTNA